MSFHPHASHHYISTNTSAKIEFLVVKTNRSANSGGITMSLKFRGYVVPSAILHTNP